MERIKSILKYGSSHGLDLPFAYDGVTGKPSVTLMAVHITFTLSCIAFLLYLYFPALVHQVWTGIGFWCLANVFYLMKKITKVKASLEEKSIDLEDDSGKA